MGVFHYKGILKDKSESELFYYYYPDYIATDDVFGEFKISLDEWLPVITFRIDAEAHGLVSTDERCVFALTHKIKKQFKESGEILEKVFFIA